MSLYGPRIRLPKLELPEIELPFFERNKFTEEKNYLKPIIIILAIIVFIAIIFIIAENNNFEALNIGFSSPIEYSWKNNPLDLTKKPYETAMLELKLTNTSKETKNISLEIIKDSENLVVDCQERFFPNVSPGNYRKTMCNILFDPKAPIYAGTYTLHIKTNFGEKKAILEIIGK